MPPSYDHLASNQLGLITRAQLRSLGWTDHHVDHAVRSDRLATVRRGVFRTPGVAASDLHPVLAPILALPHANLLASHHSAALTWDLKFIEIAPRPSLVSDQRVRLDGVTTRQCLTLPAQDRGVAGVIPATTPARTLCDLATKVHPEALASCLDDARRRRILRLSDLRVTFDRLRQRQANHRGLAVVDGLLADREGQTSSGGSKAELDVWYLLQRAGVELPVQQFDVLLDGRHFILDFAYPDRKIVIEYDPFEFHGRTKAQWLRHQRRRAALEAAGWLYVTILEDMTPDEVVAAVLAALERRTCH